MNRSVRMTRWGYLLMVHATLVVMLWKSDFTELVARRLGTWTPPEMGRSWQEAVAFHRRIDEQLPAGSLVFIGDSLILGFDVGAFGRRAANYGIGLDTTAGVLRRLDDYGSLNTASAVVILIGTNDVRYRDVDETGRNYQQILSRLGPARRVVAIGLLPVDANVLGAERNAVHLTINATLKAACDARSNCRYVDAWPLLAISGGLAPAFHSGDGLHLNRAGYERLARAVAPALEP